MGEEPASLANRQRTISRSELEMDDVEAMGDMANVDGAIEEILNDE